MGYFGILPLWGKKFKNRVLTLEAFWSNFRHFFGVKQILKKTSKISKFNPFKKFPRGKFFPKILSLKRPGTMVVKNFKIPLPC